MTAKILSMEFGGIVGMLIALSLTADITTFAVGVMALIAALFTGIVNLIVTKRALKKVEEVHEKAAEIAIKVDGTATEQRAENKALRQEIALLRADKAEQKEVAAVLAVTAAAPTKETT